MARAVKQNAGVIGLRDYRQPVAANLRKAGYQGMGLESDTAAGAEFPCLRRGGGRIGQEIFSLCLRWPGFARDHQVMAPVLGQSISFSIMPPSRRGNARSRALVRDRHANYLDAPFTGVGMLPKRGRSCSLWAVRLGARRARSQLEGQRQRFSSLEK
jgi:hypothetical protein